MTMWFKKAGSFSAPMFWELNVETNDVPVIHTRELYETTLGTGWHAKVA